MPRFEPAAAPVRRLAAAAPAAPTGSFEFTEHARGASASRHSDGSQDGSDLALFEDDAAVPAVATKAVEPPRKRGRADGSFDDGDGDAGRGGAGRAASVDVAGGRARPVSAVAARAVERGGRDRTLRVAAPSHGHSLSFVDSAAAPAPARDESRGVEWNDGCDAGALVAAISRRDASPAEAQARRRAAPRPLPPPLPLPPPPPPPPARARAAAAAAPRQALPSRSVAPLGRLAEERGSRSTVAPGGGRAPPAPPAMPTADLWTLPNGRRVVSVPHGASVSLAAAVECVSASLDPPAQARRAADFRTPLQRATSWQPGHGGSGGGGGAGTDGSADMAALTPGALVAQWAPENVLVVDLDALLRLLADAGTAVLSPADAAKCGDDGAAGGGGHRAAAAALAQQQQQRPPRRFAADVPPVAAEYRVPSLLRLVDAAGGGDDDAGGGGGGPTAWLQLPPAGRVHGRATGAPPPPRPPSVTSITDEDERAARDGRDGGSRTGGPQQRRTTAPADAGGVSDDDDDGGDGYPPRRAVPLPPPPPPPPPPPARAPPSFRYCLTAFDGPARRLYYVRHGGASVRLAAALTLAVGALKARVCARFGLVPGGGGGGADAGAAHDDEPQRRTTARGGARAASSARGGARGKLQAAGVGRKGVVPSVAPARCAHESGDDDDDGGGRGGGTVAARRGRPRAAGGRAAGGGAGATSDGWQGR